MSVHSIGKGTILSSRQECGLGVGLRTHNRIRHFSLGSDLLQNFNESVFLSPYFCFQVKVPNKFTANFLRKNKLQVNILLTVCSVANLVTGFLNCEIGVKINSEQTCV